MDIGPDIAPEDDPLAILIRQVKQHDQRYLLLGNEWYGWWTGLIDGAQVFVVVTGSHVYEPKWHGITNPDLATTNTPNPQLWVVHFCPHGLIANVETHQNASVNSIVNSGRGPSLLVPQLELFLATKYGSFVSDVISVKPFEVSEIGVDFHPLLWSHQNYLADPEDYSEDEKEDIAAWIAEKQSELLFGNDYYIDGKGICVSS